MPKQQASATEVIAGEGPVVVVVGVSYTMRRLGLRDAFKIAKVLAAGFASVSGAVKVDFTDAESAGESITTLLMAGVPFAEDEIIALLADVLQVPDGVLSDPDTFPLDSLVEVIEGITKHPDLQSFTKRLAALLRALPAAPVQSEVSPPTS
jgi:hypothetical protein